MAKNGKNKIKGSKPATEEPRSLPVFDRGVKTAHQLCGGMSLLIGDVISRRVAPNLANAACNAAGKLLKSAEMQQKYGIKSEGQDKILILA
jgi:hypothetical protein